MTNMNITDFLNMHDINWFPIRLKDKIPQPVFLYNGTPKMTDFTTLTSKQIKKRQSYYNEPWVNAIAIDTSKVYQIDIDFHDDDEVDERMDDYIYNLPYYRSVSKELGKHLFFTDTISTEKNIIKDKYLKIKNIEILKGTWGYCPKNAIIFNPNAELNSSVNSLIDHESLDKAPKLKFKKDGSHNIPLESIEPLPEDSYLFDLVDMINIDFVTDYETWYKLCYAMVKVGFSDDAIHQWSSKAPNYNEYSLSHHLKSYKDNVWLFGEQTIKHYAKISDPFKYSDFIISYKKMRLKPNDFELACYYVQLYGDDVVYIDDKLYVYSKCEWRLDKKLQIIKPMIRCALDKEVGRHITKVNLSKESTDDMEELERLSKEIAVLAKVPNYLYDYNKLTKITRFVVDILKERNDDIQFDIGEEQLYNLHYSNGVYDIKSKKFRPRTKDDYITHKLDYDYMDIEKDSPIFKEIDTIFNKLQPNEAHSKFEKQWLAYNLTGETSKQKFKCNIGYKASNGKSTLLSIHDRVFPIYTEKLDPKTFNKDYGKSHKQFAALLTQPIRLAYIEELDRDKLDPTLLKDFVDGEKLPVEILYSTKQDAKIQCKLNTNSNKDFNIEEDKGVLRRGLVQYFESVFDPKCKKDDTVNHIYTCDDQLKLKFDSVIYKNAYREVVLDGFEIDKFEIPKYAQDNFESVLGSNDEFLDWFDTGYEKTDNKDDRISIYEIIEYMKQHDTFKKIDKGTVVSSLKARGYTYDTQLRKVYKKKSVRGVISYLKIVELEELEFKDDEKDNIKNNPICQKESVIGGTSDSNIYDSKGNIVGATSELDIDYGHGKSWYS